MIFLVVKRRRKKKRRRREKLRYTRNAERCGRKMRPSNEYKSKVMDDFASEHYNRKCRLGGK
jgi:hypothetical protein